MTQVQIADLYQTFLQNINLNVLNILKEGELTEERTIKDYLIVQKEGNREISRKLAHNNPGMIIAIGYRVRSHRVELSDRDAEKEFEGVVKQHESIALKGSAKNEPGSL